MQPSLMSPCGPVFRISISKGYFGSEEDCPCDQLAAQSTDDSFPIFFLTNPVQSQKSNSLTCSNYDLGWSTHHEGPKHGSMPSQTDTQAPGSSDPL